jgi:prophage regulatory protein
VSPKLPISARDPHPGKRRRIRSKATARKKPLKRAHTPRAPPDSAERLVRMKELEQLVGLRKSTINRLIAEDRFPRGFHPLGNRIAAWRLSEIKAWIDARAAGQPA